MSQIIPFSLPAGADKTGMAITAFTVIGAGSPVSAALTNVVEPDATNAPGDYDLEVALPDASEGKLRFFADDVFVLSVPFDTTSGSGSGLTAQQTADAANNLAPAGSPAAGSLGSKIGVLLSRVAAEESTTILTPLQQGQKMQIVSGDDYGSDSREWLIVHAAGADWPVDLSEYTWTIVIDKTDDNENTHASDAITATAAVETATGDGRSLRVTIAAAASSTAEGLYDFTVRGAKAGKKWAVVCPGMLTVLKDQVSA